jgi:hypothetical protein
MPHNFWRSLEYEGGKTKRADTFYYNQFKVEEIVRFDTGSAHDMEFQRMDIDVQLYGWGRHANVSEKFRDRDFNDLYLELYSMFPQTKGWMHVKGADYLAYFFPLRMFWINKKDLTRVFEEHIEPRIELDNVRNWIHENSGKSGKCKSELNGHEIQVINAFNRVRKRSWNTVGVSVPFSLLKELGLDWKEFRL